MSRGAPFGFGPLATFARQDDPGLSPDLLALLRQRQGATPAPDDDMPTPPGFTGFAAPATPTGAPTPVVDTSGARALGGIAADAGEGFADMGRRTADLFGRIRSGEIDPGAFAKAAGAHLAGQAFETAKSAATAPRDALTGDLQVFDPATGHVSDAAMDRATGLAGLAMTGSMPLKVPSGALRTFGGRTAATADHAALDRAAAMQAGGASPDAIWRDTGWGLGRDGAARFEIPDDAARVRPHDGSATTTLGQALDHPALYQAYPGLRDVDVFHRPDLGANAAANPTKNWIALNLGDPQALESLLHEGQHIVQRKESFAPGASPIDPALASHPQVAEVTALRQRLSGIDNPAAMALADRTDQAVRMNAYRTAAGEVEARNVEGRRAMSPAERAATPPWRTQDVPNDRQWLPQSFGDAVTGDAAQLKLGPAAVDDPLAALEASLASFVPEAPPPGPRLLDPNAKSWDLYHGSNAGPDFQRFDPNASANPAERGGVFFAPGAETASDYARTGVAQAGDAGPRVFRTTVEPGKTAVLDLGHLAETDPAFNARARQIVEQQNGPGQAANFDRYMDDFSRNRAQYGELKKQVEAMGYPVSPPDPVSYGYGHIGAAVERAQAQGLDTAILRGLAEHGGDDQVVALTPGRVRSHYDPSQLLYSGGRSGGLAGVPAFARAGDPQDAETSPHLPSPRGAPPVSFGSAPFGFGPMLVPNADLDDGRRYLRRPVFDPAQAIPPGLVDAMPGADPSMPQQQAAPALPAQEPDAPARPPLRMFGSLAPQMFAPAGPEESSGSLPSLVGSQAPAMPSRAPVAAAEDAPAAPAPARPLTFGQIPVSAPAPAAPSPLPATTGSLAPPTGSTAAPSPAGPAGPAAAAEPSFLDRVGSGLRDVATDRDLLMNLGIGLMSTPGWGQGAAAGLKGYQDAAPRRAATKLAEAEYGLKAQKVQQEQLGNNATVAALIRGGYSQQDALGLVQASIAGHREGLQNALNNLYPKKEIPSGFTLDPSGTAVPIPGGPQDLATIKAQAEARQEDKTVSPLTDPTARLKAGIAQNDTRQAWIDPNGKVTFDQGETPRLITVKGANGETVTKRFNPATGQAEDIPGAAPPGVDTTGVPAGVDPATFRKEAAKAVVAEQKGATQRALQANTAMPIIDRAERAYQALAEAKAIGPYQASGINRAIGGMLGANVEVQRQEYEAAAKELELMKAQIQMKGQGSITEGERRILGMTLPRLDAASPETGMTTLRGLREQFSKAADAEVLPGRQGAAQGRGQTTGAAIPIPGPAVQALQRDPNLREQFEAKYGQGSAGRFLGGR